MSLRGVGGGERGLCAFVCEHCNGFGTGERHRTPLSVEEASLQGTSVSMRSVPAVRRYRLVSTRASGPFRLGSNLFNCCSLWTLYPSQLMKH